MSFPTWWVGPVWVQVLGPHPADVVTVELVWKPWRRRQNLRSGGVLTTRKAVLAGPPLKIRLPPAWSFIAGTGAVPQAIDVNEKWTPVSTRAAIGILRQNVQAVIKNLGRPKPRVSKRTST